MLQPKGQIVYGLPLTGRSFPLLCHLWTKNLRCLPKIILSHVDIAFFQSEPSLSISQLHFGPPEPYPGKGITRLRRRRLNITPWGTVMQETIVNFLCVVVVGNLGLLAAWGLGGIIWFVFSRKER